MNISEMRAELKGLFRVNPVIYWVDFLANLAVGYFSFYLSQKYWGTSPLLFAALLTVSSFTLYRAVIFIHEIAHARRQMPYFTFIWNLICGVPLGMPSFLYYQSHYAHHRPQTYGTALDGEYIAFGGNSRFEIFKYLFFSFIAPVLLLFRFVLLTLPSFAIPALRKWVVEHGSSLVIETDFIGSPPTASEKMDWYWQETATAVFWIAILSSVAIGYIPLANFFCFFGLMCTVHIVNALRTLAAHRFVNETLEPISLEAQYLDSVNLTGKGFSAVVNTLVAPVGLRFHALHHLFPGLPYHSLPEAHARICKAIPKESRYHLSNEPTLISSLVSLWRNTGTTSSTAEERAQLLSGISVAGTK